MNVWPCWEKAFSQFSKFNTVKDNIYVVPWNTTKKFHHDNLNAKGLIRIKMKICTLWVSVLYVICSIFPIPVGVLLCLFTRPTPGVECRGGQWSLKSPKSSKSSNDSSTLSRSHPSLSSPKSVPVNWSGKLSGRIGQYIGITTQWQVVEDLVCITMYDNGQCIVSIDGISTDHVVNYR